MKQLAGILYFQFNGKTRAIMGDIGDASSIVFWETKHWLDEDLTSLYLRTVCLRIGRIK